MKLNGPHDHNVLVALGAKRVQDITDDDGVVTGVSVEPKISVARYDAELKARQTKAAATQALAESEAVVMSCFEAGVPFPEEWRHYRKTLRAIAEHGTGDDDLPPRPEAPAGI